MALVPTHNRRIGNANDMTVLLTKIERRLGLIPITPHLPEYCNKDAWAEVIKDTTLPTFSMGFPNRFHYMVNDVTTVKKDGWIWIKDELLGNAKFLGFGDIDWIGMGSYSGAGLAGFAGYGYPDAFNYSNGGLAMSDQIAGMQLNADINSLYNNGLFLDQKPGAPAFRVSGIGNTNVSLNNFAIWVLCTHDNISTISPTSMETFEKLAMADVADLILNLGIFEELQTSIANVKLPLDRCRDASSKREEIEEKIRDAGVSANSEACPIIMTV